MNAFTGTSYGVLMFGGFLMVCGWLISFVAQCYAQSKHYFEYFPYVRTVWFTTFLQLFLCAAVFYNAFMWTPTQMITLIFLGVGIVFSVLSTDAGIYDTTGYVRQYTGQRVASGPSVVGRTELMGSPSSLRAMSAGYLLLAIGNILALIFFASKYDMEHRPNASMEDAVDMKGPSTGTGGLIGSFSGSGLRNRKGNDNKPVDTIGVSGNNAASTYPPTNVDAAPRSPDLGTPAALGRDPLSGGYGGRTDDVAINMSSNGNATNASNAKSSEPTAGQASAPGQEDYMPTRMESATKDSSNLAPPITSSNFGGAAAGGAAGGMAAGVSSGSVAGGGSQRAEALYSYKASEDDPTEISFAKGDILQIVDSSGKWWQAQRPNGELGIVPSNYLRLV